MPVNYVLLERIELNASAASVTFANIPQSGYTDLKIVLSARDGASSVIDGARVRFNNDTTSGNYTARRLIGSGSAASSDTNNVGAFAVGNTATASTFSNCEFYIPNYTGSTAKSVSFDNVAETNATTQYMGLGAFLWSGTAAITTITISGESADFLANSTFSLYGLAAVGTTPVIAPKASGGNVIATDGTYWYHAFTSSGAFVPATALTCDALVIGAGGAGGTNGRGGGAGGELFYSTAISMTQNTYICTIGAGAAWSSNGGRNGSSSVLSGAGITTITATAGQDGLDPGGGAGRNNGASGGSYATTGVAGGTGVSTYSTFGSVTSTGQNVSGTYYYVGGGGGGANNSTNSAGGSGGGGRGGSFQGVNPLPALAGTANTGGGGGGMGNGETTTNSNGGSGVIIIRYTIA